MLWLRPLAPRDLSSAVINRPHVYSTQAVRVKGCGVSVRVQIGLHNSDTALMPAVCFPAAACFVPSLKIIVSVAQTGTSSAGAAPLWANRSPALRGGTARVRLPRLADQRVRSFFFCGFWQQLQIPPRLSVQSAGQTCSQPAAWRKTLLSQSSAFSSIGFSLYVVL